MQTMTRAVLARAVGAIVLIKAFASAIRADTFVGNEWWDFTVTWLFWAVAAAAGAGVVMLRPWGRRLCVAVPTLYAIVLLSFAFFACVLAPYAMRECQSMPGEWMALFTDPVFLLSQTSVDHGWGQS